MSDTRTVHADQVAIGDLIVSGARRMRVTSIRRLFSLPYPDQHRPGLEIVSEADGVHDTLTCVAESRVEVVVER